MISLALTLAIAVTPQQQVDEFRKAALAERKKLGLEKDPKALTAKYPTPEMVFAGPPGKAGKGGHAVLCPGQTTQVVLEGKLPSGSAVFVMSEDIEVLQPQVSATKWSASLKVKPDAAPDRVGIQAIGAVSAGGQYLHGLAIGCKHTWVIDLDNSETLTGKTDWDGVVSSLTAPADWSKGGKALGTNSFSVMLGDSINFSRVSAPDEIKARIAAIQAANASPEVKALDEKRNALTKEMQGCGKLKGKEISACFTRLNGELKPLLEQREAILTKASQTGAPEHGCNKLHLEVVKAGAITGYADECFGKKRNERIKFKGRYTSP